MVALVKKKVSLGVLLERRRMLRRVFRNSSMSHLHSSYLVIGIRERRMGLTWMGIRRYVAVM